MTSPKQTKAADETRAAGPPPDDNETIDMVTDPRGRTHPVLHGTGAPSVAETAEQGAVRTGRKPAEHAPDRDSAGLTVEETERREAHTRDERAKLMTELEHQGTAAGGDSPHGGKRTVPTDHPPRGERH